MTEEYCENLKARHAPAVHMADRDSYTYWDPVDDAAAEQVLVSVWNKFLLVFGATAILTAGAGFIFLA